MKFEKTVVLDDVVFTVSGTHQSDKGTYDTPAFSHTEIESVICSENIFEFLTPKTLEYLTELSCEAVESESYEPEHDE